jgi:hypothetical protein
MDSVEPGGKTPTPAFLAGKGFRPSSHAVVKIFALVTVFSGWIALAQAAPPRPESFDGICIYKAKHFLPDERATVFPYSTAVHFQNVTWIFRPGASPLQAKDDSYFLLLPLSGRGQTYPEIEIAIAYKKFPHLRKTLDRVQENWARHAANPTERYAEASQRRFQQALQAVAPERNETLSSAPFGTGSALRSPMPRAASLSSEPNQKQSGQEPAGQAEKPKPSQEASDSNFSVQAMESFMEEHPVAGGEDTPDGQGGLQKNLETIKSYFHLLRIFNQEE